MASEDDSGEETRVLPVDAAKQLGVTKTTLYRYADTGVISVQRDPKGNRFFLQDDIDSFKERRNGTDQVAVLTANQNELTTIALDHVRKTFELMHDPALAVLNILKAECAALRERCSQLEQVNTDLIRAREEALNQQHERDLATVQVESSLRRKDEVLAILKDVSKPLMASVAATMATSVNAADTKTAAMYDFLSKVDTDKIRTLLAMPFLDEEEKESLKKLLASFDVKLDMSGVQEAATDDSDPKPD